MQMAQHEDAATAARVHLKHRMITTGSTHDAPIAPLPGFTITIDDSRRTAVVNSSKSDDGRSRAAGPGGLALRSVSLAGLLVADAVDVAPAAAGVSGGARGAMVTIGVQPRAVNDRTPQYHCRWIRCDEHQCSGQYPSRYWTERASWRHDSLSRTDYDQ